MFVHSSPPPRQPRVRILHAIAFAAILVALALSGPAQAAFSTFRVTSTNPSHGPSNAGTGFPGVVVCYANGSLQATNCGPVGFPGANPSQMLLSASNQAAVTLIDGNPYLTFVPGGASTTPTAFQDIWLTELSAQGLDFGGLTVIQKSGATQTLTVELRNSSNVVLSSSTHSIPSDTPTAVTVSGAGTTDFYRMHAFFGSAITWGANSFLLQVTGSGPTAPAVTTQAASGIGTGGATLAGTVSANGDSTAASFEYGLTTAYGSTATAAQSPLASGATNASVSAAVSGLACATTYHFRARATNSAGTTVGGDLTFATLACPNLAPTASALTFGGSAVFGQTLSGGYTYGDAESDAEDATAGGTAWRVVRSVDNSVATAGDNTGAASGTTGGAAVSHVVSTADVGSYLFFCVTPKASAGTSPGAEACSAAVGPVSKAPQAIAFGAAPAVTVGGTGTVSATGGGSGNAVTFASQTPGTCTVVGTTVTGVSGGGCTIVANQAGNAAYLPAPQATLSFDVAKIPQSITFGTLPTLAFGATGAISATGGASGNPVTFSSQTPAVCTVSGTAVSAIAVGSCAIAADQAGNANYLAAPRIAVSFGVTKAAQAIVFGPAPALAVGGTASVGATGGASGNPVSFASGTPSTCVVNGTTLTGIAAGVCTVFADQAGNDSYLPAPQAWVTFPVGKVPQAIAFGPAPLLAVGGSGIVTATGGPSGNPVVFSSLTPAVCDVNGTRVSGLAPGACRIAADQAGDARHDEAPQATLDISAFAPQPNLTAAWWNPDESGWGVFVNHQGSTIHAAIFTYAADGEPMWLVGSNVEWRDDGTFAGPLYRTSGPRLGQFPWTAFQVTPVGEISLSFESDSRATLRYSYREGTAVHAVTKSIRRMDFQAEVPACVSSTGSRAAEWNVQDLWWDPMEPGWGLDVAHQGGVVFATLFTYDTAGRDLWLVASRLERRDDGSWFGDLLRTSSPGFDPHHWKGIAWRRVGTLEFHPVDGENGHAVFSVDGIVVEKRVQRMVFGSTVPACR